MLTVNSFSFQTQDLLQKLSQVSHETSGYWQFTVYSETNSNLSFWFLALSRGRVVFSGTEKLSWEALLATLQRYILRLRNDSVKRTFLALEQQLTPDRPELMGILLDQVQKMDLLSPAEVSKALWLQTLSDFDAYLFSDSGEAQFEPEPLLDERAPISGFEISLIRCAF